MTQWLLNESFFLSLYDSYIFSAHVRVCARAPVSVCERERVCVRTNKHHVLHAEVRGHFQGVAFSSCHVSPSPHFPDMDSSSMEGHTEGHAGF